VVLPLPGHSVTFPNHIVTQRCREYLAADGLKMEDFSENKLKEFALPGGYRKIVEIPGDLQWKHFLYNDATKPLVLTDVEKMQGLPEPQSIPDGKKRAIALSFTLPPSTYATMCLRELLKSATTVHAQRLLNDQEAEEDGVLKPKEETKEAEQAESAEGVESAVAEEASAETASAGELGDAQQEEAIEESAQ